jgi:mono/diheme cytochrome c family protein
VFSKLLAEEPMMNHKPFSPIQMLALSLVGAVGAMALTSSPNASAQSAPTYYRDIQKILVTNCVTCHVADGIAPFALDNGQDAVTWAKAMAAAVQSGSMPPFPPGEDSPPFLDERKLGATDKKLIIDWVKAGAPLGQKSANQNP